MKPLLPAIGALLILICSEPLRPALEVTLNAQATRAITLATVVPEGSVWDRNLSRWRRSGRRRPAGG